jgi:2-polyprenyl-6-methoxyphenol hydroxylase-like FAD-dependent oxidoreductase
MAQRSAVVIGAGIGGLTAALALHLRGLRVTVLERAARLEPVGAGIALAPNAVKALDTLGLADWLGGAAAIQGSGGVRKPDGTWLVRTELGLAGRRFGRPLLVVPRPELVEALVTRLPAGALRLGTTVEGVEPGDAGDAGDVGRPALVRTRPAGAAENPAGEEQPGEEIAADLVVVADGIRSAVRGALFPAHPGPKYAGFTAWRMITDVPDGVEISPSETWGRGAVFGIVPLPHGRLYCYATANLPAGTAFPDEKAALAGRFADWHEPIPALIRQTPPESLLRNDIWELAESLPRFHQGRVVLLGDAAHAMTPNLGQGGCQAIEDAVVLAHHVSGDGAAGAVRSAGSVVDLADAVAAYTADRLARTTRIVRQSARVGRMQQVDSPLRVGLRDAMIRLAGKAGPGLMLRQMAPLASWTPPSPAGPAEATDRPR